MWVADAVYTPLWTPLLEEHGLSPRGLFRIRPMGRCLPNDFGPQAVDGILTVLPHLVAISTRRSSIRS